MPHKQFGRALQAFGAAILVTTSGGLSWLDLTVSNAGATLDFYRQVVGWSVQNVEIEHGDERYTDFNMLRRDGPFTPRAWQIPAAGVAFC